MFGQNPPYETVVFLTYNGTADPGYANWLRSTDNPFFNSRPGIVNYSNWQIIEAKGASLPFSHFDLVGIEGIEALETVWFDPEMDKFRRDWVSRWGYTSTGAFFSHKEQINQYGYLANRTSGQRGVKGEYLRLLGGNLEIEGSDGEKWQVKEVLRKQWAIGPPTTGEQWRTKAEQNNPLSFGGFALQTCNSIEEWDSSLPSNFGFAAIATCLAAPDLPDA